MKSLTELRQLVLWNLGYFVLVLGIAGMVFTGDLPQRLSASDLQTLTAGGADGTDSLVYADTNEKNECFYCNQVGLGFVGCNDTSLGPWAAGILTYRVQFDDPCFPETHYPDNKCKINQGKETKSPCTTKKPFWVDP